jgi:hypothetical protein
MKSTATDDHHRHHLASRNPAGSHPPDPVPQTLGGSLAAGDVSLRLARVSYQLSAPTVVHDPTRRRFPRPVRMILRMALRIVGANDFMDLSTARGHGAAS